MPFDIGQKIAEEKESYLSAVRARSERKRIFIYGAGDYGKKLAARLEKHGIHVDGYVVTQTKYNQTAFHGVPVRAFSELVSEKDRILFLIGVKAATQKSVERTLQAAGVTDYLLPPVHLAEMLDNTFARPVVEVTPKAGCSVHCRYCPQDLFLHRYFSEDRQPEMTFDEFRGYLEKLPQETIIDFSGFVEPFLAKDGVEMVRYAHESGHAVRLYTTLVGIDLDGFHAIEDIPFRNVVLHLPDIHQYANIPVTDAYLELLQYVVAKCRPNGDSFVDLATCQAEPDPCVLDIVHQRFPISWDLNDRAGNLDGGDLQSKATGIGDDASGFYCGRALHLNHNVLLPNGDLVLCCMDFGMRHVLGNLRRQSYEEIMNGSEMKKLMRGLSREEDTLCKTCTSIRCRSTSCGSGR